MGGYRLHMACSGQGSPTVVLIHGFRGTRNTWRQVHPQAARFTTVCSYSRAGLGRSEPRPDRRAEVDGGRLAEELHELLQRTGIRPPYVPVGHSFGGAIAQLFAERYPSEVRGVVLVDPVPAAFLSVPRSRLYRIAGRERVQRLLTNGVREGGTRVDIQRLGEELLAAGGLGAVPLVLLTRGLTPPESTPAFEDLWSDLQRQEAQLSSNSVHVVAARSGHGIPSEQPSLVIRAIREVMTSGKMGSPLAPCRRAFVRFGGECPP